MIQGIEARFQSLGRGPDHGKNTAVLWAEMLDRFVVWDEIGYLCPVNGTLRIVGLPVQDSTEPICDLINIHGSPSGDVNRDARNARFLSVPCELDSESDPAVIRHLMRSGTI